MLSNPITATPFSVRDILHADQVSSMDCYQTHQAPQQQTILPPQMCNQIQQDYYGYNNIVPENSWDVDRYEGKSQSYDEIDQVQQIGQIVSPYHESPVTEDG